MRTKRYLLQTIAKVEGKRAEDATEHDEFHFVDAWCVVPGCQRLKAWEIKGNLDRATNPRRVATQGDVAIYRVGPPYQRFLIAMREVEEKTE